MARHQDSEIYNFVTILFKVQNDHVTCDVTLEHFGLKYEWK